jgi:antitoxin HicB
VKTDVKSRSKKGSVILVYGAKLKKDGGSYLVTFRDLDNVFTEGRTIEEAVFNAGEALDGVLASMLENGFAIPEPTPPKAGEYPIPVGLSVSAPLSLYLLRKRMAMTQAAVAKILKVTYQGYQQLEKPGANITAKRLQEAAAAMGAVVELKLTPIGELKIANN